MAMIQMIMYNIMWTIFKIIRYLPIAVSFINYQREHPTKITTAGNLQFRIQC
jgi:hypothetical protein